VMSLRGFEFNKVAFQFAGGNLAIFSHLEIMFK